MQVFILQMKNTALVVGGLTVWRRIIYGVDVMFVKIIGGTIVVQAINESQASGDILPAPYVVSY